MAIQGTYMPRLRVLRGSIAMGLVPLVLALPVSYGLGTTPCEFAPLGAISGTATEGEGDVAEPPNVIGRQIDGAEAELRSLKWDVIRDPALPPPQVDDQLVVVVAQVVLDDVDENRMALCIGTTVPDLIDLTFEDADAALDERGLVGISVTEDAAPDWVVNGQGLNAGELVRFGTQLRYSLVPPVSPDPTELTPSPSDPDTLTAVPDLIGKRAARARRLVERAGLVMKVELVGRGNRRGRIVRQDPPPGTLVPGDTEVTAFVRLRGAVSPSPTSWSTWAVPAALLLVIAAAIASSAYIRSRLQRRWVRDHISVRAVTDHRPVATAHETAPATGGVRVRAHRDRGIQTVEEVQT